MAVTDKETFSEREGSIPCEAWYCPFQGLKMAYEFAAVWSADGKHNVVAAKRREFVSPTPKLRNFQIVKGF